MSHSNKSPHSIIALHGFLGLAGDWRLFHWISHPMPLMKEDLSLWDWAEHCNGVIPPRGNILIGYSLGGRLGMHLLIQSPYKWEAAVLISAHPGLAAQEERRQRLETDCSWSQRFLQDPWEDLLHDWNQNPIFGQIPCALPRKEAQFNRLCLSKQLINWSLGKQDDLIPQLKKLNIPLLYLSGEKDLKFNQISKEFAPFCQSVIVEGAAHRIPWEKPFQFETLVKSFIEKI